MREIEVHDIVRMQMPDGYRVWKVTGIYLGSSGSESLIGLRPVDIKCGSAHGANADETLVPRELTECLEIV